LIAGNIELPSAASELNATERHLIACVEPALRLREANALHNPCCDEGYAHKRRTPETML
jgi:hypothetical protein